MRKLGFITYRAVVRLTNMISKPILAVLLPVSSECALQEICVWFYRMRGAVSGAAESYESVGSVYDFLCGAAADSLGGFGRGV